MLQVVNQMTHMMMMMMLIMMIIIGGVRVLCKKDERKNKETDRGDKGLKYSVEQQEAGDSRPQRKEKKTT